MALARSTAVLQAGVATGAPAGLRLAAAALVTLVASPAGRSPSRTTAPSTIPPTRASTASSPATTSQAADGRPGPLASTTSPPARSGGTPSCAGGSH